MIVCIPCGIDLRTGAAVRPRLEAPAVNVAAVEATPERPGFKFWLMSTYPGLFSPLVLVTSVAAGFLGLVGISLALYLVVTFLAVFGAALTGAAGLIVWAQAMAWLVYGRLTLLHEALVDFDGKAWSAWATLAFLPVVAVMVLMGLMRPESESATTAQAWSALLELAQRMVRV